MKRAVVIIGASHAAAQASVSLRQGGYDGKITVIGDEPDLPYHRPPLSKDFLSGNKVLDDILIRPASGYEAANICLLYTSPSPRDQRGSRMPSSA